MKRIAGLIYTDRQRSAENETVNQMLAALVPPRAAHVLQREQWVQGSVGLGGLYRGAESPIYAADGFTILADAQIHNRTDLWRALGGNETETDAALILHAYQKWGEACADHLLGEFAFAIWDGRKQSLFCARDRFGTRPFYFVALDDSRGVFAFASETKALWMLPEVRRRVNLERVGLYLASAYQSRADTYYQDVQRLEPGWWVRISPEGRKAHKYWTLRADANGPGLSNAEYVAQFRTLLREAIRCRLPEPGELTISVSGGLDSSAILCGARDLYGEQGRPQPVQGISAIYPDVPETDEQEYLDTLKALDRVQIHPFRADRIDPIGALDEMTERLDEPIDAPNLFLSWTIGEIAQSLGAHVEMDGHDGDSVVSHGLEFITEYASRDDWATARHLADSLVERKALYSMTMPGIFNNLISPLLDDYASKGQWIRLARASYQAARAFDRSRNQLLREYVARPFVRRLRRKSTENAVIPDTLNPDFARTANLQRQLEDGALTHPFRTTMQESHLDLMQSSLHASALEITNKTSATFGLEPSHPFMDQRLIEFCVNLPQEQRVTDGWTRYILRQAIEGSVPAEIQWRGGKSNLGLSLYANFVGAQKQNIESLLVDDSGRLSQFFQMPILREETTRFFARPTEKQFMLLWHAITIERWIRAVENG